MSDPYAAHARFIRPAWPLRDIWRIAVMVVLVEFIFGVTPGIMALLLPPAALEIYVDGTSATGTLMQFAAFGIPALGIVGLLHLLHHRGFWSLIGDAPAAWVDLKRVTVAVVAVLLLLEALPRWGDPAMGAQMRNFGIWVALVPVALLVLLVQVGAEEMFFRGYLQQQLACLSSSRWVWMGVPSVLFGLVHYWNGFGTADGVIWAIWAALLGLACADLTARTGNLGAAIGLHLANNILAVLLYGVQGWPASGLALFVYPYADPAEFASDLGTLLSSWAIVQLLIQAALVYVMWLAARIAIRR
ncbi:MULTISPECIES: CPBP family intramembrane glutamic endopeptidase [unclassified Yoonia]|uniref:CPBP family intramembrane glutamic endopeptidase n=1 Tax=unclassified Yoonia TaxID=2629118 RepID=UPI002AFE7759|nr:MULTISPECIES: CPBP family intramembrane glutamic endopeptidase [unclassified Yoonia]